MKMARKTIGVLLAAGLAAVTLINGLPAPAGGAGLLATLHLRGSSSEEEEPSSSAQEDPSQWLPMTTDRLHGVWIGELPVQVTRGSEIMLVYDRVVLNIDLRRDPVIMMSLESLDKRYQPMRAWQIADNTLVFAINDSPWRAVARLHFTDDATLTGDYEQYGVSRELTLVRSSYEPDASELPTGYVFEGKSGQEWLDELAKYPKYAKSAGEIPFTYELMRPEPFRSAINAYNLSRVYDNMRYANLSDVDRMKRLLDFVSDNFLHDGAAQVTDTDLNPLRAVQFYQNNGGIECRGLSAILAELLRIDGIPAKPVMCIPSIEPSEDCHVVVHAYSASLGQWIMLDPTYHLILRDGAGRYVSLPMLRQALIDGTTLTANPDAGHNDMPFSMEYYRAYMAKNTFRFSCLLDNSFTAQESKSNKTYMLTPEGWAVPYRWSRPEVITTSADDFWAAPPQELLDQAAQERLAQMPQSGRIVTPEEAIQIEPKGDFFVLDGIVYRYAGDLDWVMQMDLVAAGRCGTIRRTGVKEGFQDWDATSLQVGAQVFASSGGDSLLLAEKKDGLLYPYLRWTEE